MRSLAKSFSSEESLAVRMRCPMAAAYVLRTAALRSASPDTNAARILPVCGCGGANEAIVVHRILTGLPQIGALNRKLGQMN